MICKNQGDIKQFSDGNQLLSSMKNITLHIKPFVDIGGIFKNKLVYLKIKTGKQNLEKKEQHFVYNLLTDNKRHVHCDNHIYLS